MIYFPEAFAPGGYTPSSPGYNISSRRLAASASPQGRSRTGVFSSQDELDASLVHVCFEISRSLTSSAHHSVHIRNLLRLKADVNSRVIGTTDSVLTGEGLQDNSLLGTIRVCPTGFRLFGPRERGVFYKNVVDKNLRVNDPNLLADQDAGLREQARKSGSWKTDTVQLVPSAVTSLAEGARYLTAGRSEQDGRRGGHHLPVDLFFGRRPRAGLVEARANKLRIGDPGTVTSTGTGGFSIYQARLSAIDLPWVLAEVDLMGCMHLLAAGAHDQHFEAFKTVIEVGRGIPFLPDARDDTPLMLAVRGRCLQTANFLLQYDLFPPAPVDDQSESSESTETKSSSSGTSSSSSYSSTADSSSSSSTSVDVAPGVADGFLDFIAAQGEIPSRLLFGEVLETSLPRWLRCVFELLCCAEEEGEGGGAEKEMGFFATLYPAVFAACPTTHLPRKKAFIARILVFLVLRKDYAKLEVVLSELVEVQKISLSELSLLSLPAALKPAMLACDIVSRHSIGYLMLAHGDPESDSVYQNLLLDRFQFPALPDRKVEEARNYGFLTAVINGDHDRMRELIFNHRYCLDVRNFCDGVYENTCLHWAALNNHMEICVGLLEMRADPCRENNSGEVPADVVANWNAVLKNKLRTEYVLQNERREREEGGLGAALGMFNFISDTSAGAAAADGAAGSATGEEQAFELEKGGDGKFVETYEVTLEEQAFELEKEAGKATVERERHGRDGRAEEEETEEMEEGREGKKLHGKHKRHRRDGKEKHDGEKHHKHHHHHKGEGEEETLEVEGGEDEEVVQLLSEGLLTVEILSCENLPHTRFFKQLVGLVPEAPRVVVEVIVSPHYPPAQRACNPVTNAPRKTKHVARTKMVWKGEKDGAKKRDSEGDPLAPGAGSSITTKSAPTATTRLCSFSPQFGGAEDGAVFEFEDMPSDTSVKLVVFNADSYLFGGDDPLGCCLFHLKSEILLSEGAVDVSLAKAAADRRGEAADEEADEGSGNLMGAVLSRPLERLQTLGASGNQDLEGSQSIQFRVSFDRRAPDARG